MEIYALLQRVENNHLKPSERQLNEIRKKWDVQQRDRNHKKERSKCSQAEEYIDWNIQLRPSTAGLSKQHKEWTLKQVIWSYQVRITKRKKMKKHE